MRYGHVNGPHIIIRNKCLLNLCSNDYLGIHISDNLSGQMQSSSRLVSGNDVSFQILEKKLAKHKSQEGSLIFPTGYMANIGAISTLNDIDDLSSKLNHSNKRKFVLTEGIFSMDGDFADLKKITEVAEKKNAITILDDAHGDFTIGRDGKGTPNHFDVAKKIDLYVSSLSKGLGSFGGYVATQRNIIDLLINKSKSFIYTSALPSFLV